MINDEALVQTNSLLTQLSLTTNQRNPGWVGDMVRIRVADRKQGPLQGQQDSLERKGIQGSLRQERGDGGVAGKGGAQGSSKSPQKLSSPPQIAGAGGAVPPAEAAEKPQAPTSSLCCLFYLSDSSACHSLTSSFTSVRGRCSASPRHL